MLEKQTCKCKRSRSWLRPWMSKKMFSVFCHMLKMFEVFPQLGFCREFGSPKMGCITPFSAQVRLLNISLHRWDIANTMSSVTAQSIQTQRLWLWLPCFSSMVLSTESGSSSSEKPKDYCILYIYTLYIVLYIYTLYIYIHYILYVYLSLSSPYKNTIHPSYIYI